MTPDVGSLRAALERSPIPLAKWLPSGKAAHLTADDYEWLAEKCLEALAEPVTPEPAPSEREAQIDPKLLEEALGTIFAYEGGPNGGRDLQRDAANIAATYARLAAATPESR